MVEKIRLCAKKLQQQPVEYKCFLIVDDELQIAFRIAIVSNQRGKGKQDNRNRYEMNSRDAYLRGNRCLNIGHSCQSVLDTKIQQHEGCRRADENRINKNRYRLAWSPLMDEIRPRICTSILVRYPAIGKQSPLDAIHNTGACKASQDCL